MGIIRYLSILHWDTWKDNSAQKLAEAANNKCFSNVLNWANNKFIAILFTLFFFFFVTLESSYLCSTI